MSFAFQKIVNFVLCGSYADKTEMQMLVLTVISSLSIGKNMILCGFVCGPSHHWQKYLFLRETERDREYTWGRDNPFISSSICA